MMVSMCICQGLLLIRIFTISCWSAGGEKTRKDQRSGRYICSYSERIWDMRPRNMAQDCLAIEGSTIFRNMYIEHRVILLYIVLELFFLQRVPAF